jgi:hypothetical protein
VNRRALLRGLAPLAAGAVAGCLGDGRDGGGTDDGDAGGSPTDAPEPSPTDTPSPDGATGGSRLVDRSFAVLEEGCGSGRESADATRDGSRVIVTGTITGSDGCHTARLAGATYARIDGRLRVEVETYVPSSTATMACAACLVDIDYEATFTFEGGAPGEVVIVHDGETVATVSLPA